MSNARKLGNMTTHGLDGDFNVDPTDNTLVVNSTNNRVGIGSATPTTTLDITGTATATAFSGPLTGNVTGTTSSISNHDTDALSEGSTNLYFTNARADARAQLKIDALVDSAPGTLDTLNELAAALGDDASFSTTVTNSIATKLPLAGGTLTGSLDVNSFQRILANNALFFMNTNNSASSYLKNTLGAGAADLRLGVMGDDKVTILSNGNVGIGTTSPATRLNVKSGGAGNSYGSLYLEIDTATNYPAMVIQTATGGNNTETHGLYIKNTAAGYGLRIDDTSGDTSPFVVDSGAMLVLGQIALMENLQLL